MKFGNPATKVLGKIGDKILFQVSREKWWPAKWKSSMGAYSLIYDTVYHKLNKTGNIERVNIINNKANCYIRYI